MAVQSTPSSSPLGSESSSWRVFHSNGQQHHPDLPEPPPWRRFAAPHDGTEASAPGNTNDVRPYVLHDQTQIDIVNAAIYLRRPLLVTGRPGTGKSSLARAIAHELDLGPILHWPVNSRSALQDALYRYDAIGRLQDSGLRPGSTTEQPPAPVTREAARSQGTQDSDHGIGAFIRLGPLGTALVPTARPRVLLIDELDKGDLDLPNDLLTVFEEGYFEIPELSRLPHDQDRIKICTADRDGHTVVTRGLVRCTEFPVVVITTNGERDFPPAFLRRCVPLYLRDPAEEQLREIITAHLKDIEATRIDDLVEEFLARRALDELATDQILNAVFLRVGGARVDPDGLMRAVLHALNKGR
ncbi:ATPase AAA [Streptomyces sp. XY431]|uniref:AAA family ATPase n=1 Tax=Streptomyces sp. XY431 TaxID=1415562 RepID=UPI0006AE66F7|nr:MoxR family ATPase [Streptomyces sp. XY431]KOV10492.1 ATPase AAA [Streptomyces sp. XY431]